MQNNQKLYNTTTNRHRMTTKRHATRERERERHTQNDYRQM